MRGARASSFVASMLSGEDIVREAQALAVSFEETRQMQPKTNVEEYCVTAGSPAWRRFVLGDIGSRGVAASHPTSFKKVLEDRD